MKKLKIGIIGYGKMGKVRHNAVEKSGKAEVIVIFDPKQVIPVTAPFLVMASSTRLIDSAPGRERPLAVLIEDLTFPSWGLAAVFWRDFQGDGAIEGMGWMGGGGGRAGSTGRKQFSSRCSILARGERGG